MFERTVDNAHALNSPSSSINGNSSLTKHPDSFVKASLKLDFTKLLAESAYLETLQCVKKTRITPRSTERVGILKS